jgi:predicted phage gp36 major capsid-like protein
MGERESRPQTDINQYPALNFSTFEIYANPAVTQTLRDDANVDVAADAAPYRRNATWLMNSTTLGVVRKLKDSEGRYLWQPPVAAGQPATLLGYPLEADENMPNIGANTFPIAFGDWRAGYLIVDRIGIRVLRDALTNKPYVHFYTTTCEAPVLRSAAPLSAAAT